MDLKKVVVVDVLAAVEAVVYASTRSGKALFSATTNLTAGLCQHSRYGNLRAAEHHFLWSRSDDNQESDSSETMAPWDDFDAVFGFNKNVVYDGKVIEQIISNRRALDNRLFADRLLGLLGVKAGKEEEEERMS